MSELMPLHPKSPHSQKVKGERFLIKSASPLIDFTMSRYKSISFEIGSANPEMIQIVSEHPMRTGDFVVTAENEDPETIVPDEITPLQVSYTVPAGKIKIRWK